MNDLQQYVAEEYIEHYKEGEVSRRSMLRRVALIVGSAMLTVGYLEQHGISTTAEEVLAAGPELAPASQGNAVTVQPDDPAIRAGYLVYPAEDGKPLLGYLARPAAIGEKFPGVIQIHENRGPTAHHEDVTRRLARDGFISLMLDLTSRAGGLGALIDPAQVGPVLTASPDQNVSDLQASVKALLAREDVRPGGVGVVGYCFGGGMTWRLATKDPNVLAAAPHYGSAPPLTDVPNIKAKVTAIYAEDDNITRNFPSLEEALRSAGVNYEAIIYPGTRHAFHNDTGQSYNAEAAKDAYARTVALFKATLPSM